ncbi:MAG: hypothetical protein K9K67_08170 [Bacteriovoracaceae bacterium]|nr:hypothetical protein [Bacteriovoracaceae bacterium]
MLLIFTTIIAFSYSVQAQVFFYETNVDKLNYKYKIEENKKIILNEKTIQLVIEKNKCNENLYNELERPLHKKLTLFKEYQKKKGSDQISCEGNNLERQICSFNKNFPKEFQRVLIQEKFLCEEK